MVTCKSVQAKTLGLGNGCHWWLISLLETIVLQEMLHRVLNVEHIKFWLGQRGFWLLAFVCALGRPFAFARRQLLLRLLLRCHKTHEAPKMTRKVMQNLVVQVWSSVLWVDVEIFRIVLGCLTTVFRSKSTCPSKEFARRRSTELLLVTKIRVDQTASWLPIIFSSLCWENFCPGKLWRWNDLKQGSTLFQGFWLCSRCCWLSFDWRFSKTGRQSLNKWRNTWCPFSYIKTSCFQCCDDFTLQLSGALNIWGSYEQVVHIHVVIDCRAEAAVGAIVC